MRETSLIALCRVDCDGGVFDQETVQLFEGGNKRGGKKKWGGVGLLSVRSMSAHWGGGEQFALKK